MWLHGTFSMFWSCQVVRCQGESLFCFQFGTSFSTFYDRHVMVSFQYHHLQQALFVFLFSFLQTLKDSLQVSLWSLQNLGWKKTFNFKIKVFLFAWFMTRANKSKCHYFGDQNVFAELVVNSRDGCLCCISEASSTGEANWTERTITTFPMNIISSDLFHVLNLYHVLLGPLLVSFAICNLYFSIL